MVFLKAQVTQVASNHDKFLVQWVALPERIFPATGVLGCRTWSLTPMAPTDSGRFNMFFLIDGVLKFKPSQQKQVCEGH